MPHQMWAAEQPSPLEWLHRNPGLKGRTEKAEVISGIIMIRDVMRNSVRGWIEKKKKREELTRERKASLVSLQRSWRKIPENV